MTRILFFLLIAAVFLLMDVYVYQAIRTVSRGLSETAQRVIASIYCPSQWW